MALRRISFLPAVRVPRGVRILGAGTLAAGGGFSSFMSISSSSPYRELILQPKAVGARFFVVGGQTYRAKASFSTLHAMPGRETVIQRCLNCQLCVDTNAAPYQNPSTY